MPEPAPTVQLDAADPDFVADPYPTFAELRRHGAVHPAPELARGPRELTVAVGHAACSALLRHRSMGRVWRDAQPADQFRAVNLLHRNSLLECEGRRHVRLRRAASVAFGPGRIRHLHPRVIGIADRLVAGLAARIAADGAADLLAHVAVPLPLQVATELLGLPPADAARIQSWSTTIVKIYERAATQQERRGAELAAADFVDYLAGHAEARRARRGRDVLSDLVHGGQLGRDEVVGTAALLLMAGHEAGVNVVGNGVFALLSTRAQWDRLVADPGLLDAAVEELIRFDAPLQLFERTALADADLDGYPVAAGDTVAALLGAAARDPAVFDRPDALDIGRVPNPHLGFGAGVHYCLGAPLARLEVRAALAALTARLPGLRLEGEPGRRDEFVIRGLTELRVSAGPWRPGPDAGRRGAPPASVAAPRAPAAPDR